MDPNG
jgi:TFIIF-interacting CTD phosphatase-like protein